MKMKEPCDPAILKELLRYDDNTGFLYWLERPERFFAENANQPRWQTAKAWNNKMSGKRAFYLLGADGYYYGGLFDESMRCQRVVWALKYGYWPKGYIDHINGVTTDNRLENLRDVTTKINGQNCKRSKRNLSGFTGVGWDKRYKKWRARIHLNDKDKHIGYFDNIDDAISARMIANHQCGFHPNHGRYIE